MSIEINRLRCISCASCACVCPQSCITMQVEEGGFCKPVVNHDHCTECNACRQRCPVDESFVLEEHPPLSALMCYATDEGIRAQSSSGGVFSLLATQVLANGGVVAGAAIDEGGRVHHTLIDSTADLQRLRQSKYVQSDLGRVYQNIRQELKQGRSVLFCGTPCQTAGLRAFLGGTPMNLLSVDFICHGVPSPTVWKSYLRYLENRYLDTVSSIHMRDKRTGWKHFSLTITFSSGKSMTQPVAENPYFQMFISNACLSSSCYACLFKNGRSAADITLSDCWSVRYLWPEADDDKGISVAYARTEHGEQAMQTIIPLLMSRPVDWQDATTYQSSYFHSSEKQHPSERILKDAEKLSFDHLYEKYLGDGWRAKCRRAWYRLTTLKQTAHSG